MGVNNLEPLSAVNPNSFFRERGGGGREIESVTDRQTHSLRMFAPKFVHIFCVIVFACVSVCVEAFANARVCSWQINFLLVFLVLLTYQASDITMVVTYGLQLWR